MPVDRFIRKLDLFGPLSDADKQLIKQAIEGSSDYEANEDILQRGETSRFVHLLFDGWAGRYADLPNGDRQITAYLLPGDLCNRHMTVMREMDHSVGALSHCRIAMIREDRFDDLVNGHDNIGKAFQVCAAVDEAIAREWLVSLGRRTAIERVAHLLCEMHSRLKVVGLCEDDSFALPLRQANLADMMGLSLVHLNRSLRKLQDDGLIAYHSRQMSILDSEALRRLAGFDPRYLGSSPYRIAPPRPDSETGTPVSGQNGGRGGGG